MLFSLHLCGVLLHTIVAQCAQSLVPQSRSFQSLHEMKESTFWNNFVMGRNPVVANTTAIYINETNSVYYFEDRQPSTTWSSWFKSKPPLSMIELLLGSEPKEVPIDYFPLVTVSAELSTSDASVEREVTDGFSISFSLDLRVDNNVVIAGIKTGLSSQYTIGFSLAQSMICRAPRGGKVQMQVSATILYFPLAKTRRVSYVEATQDFETGEWETVTSEVKKETYEGAMFYSLSTISRQRCVTEKSHFKNRRVRWLPLLFRPQPV